jgi:hypothetical protein
MSTDFRALCAELLQPLVEYDDNDNNPFHKHHELIRRAETALDQPPAAGPTAADFHAWWRERAHAGTAPSPYLEQTAMAWAAFCLDRWGRPAVVPVPVSERLPPALPPALVAELDVQAAGLIQRANAALAQLKFQRSVRLDEGRVQRGNGSGGPSAPKPALVPQGISSPRSDGSSPRSDGSSPRSVTPAPLDRCPGEGHWEGDEFQWMEGCDDCRRRTATEGPVTVRPPQIIIFECPYRIEP